MGYDKLFSCSLEQLHLNKNSINCLWYPEYDTVHDQLGCESVETSGRPFQNLRCLLLGKYQIFFMIATLDDFGCPNGLVSFLNQGVITLRTWLLLTR